MAQTKNFDMEGTPGQLAGFLEQLSHQKRYRIVEVEEEKQATEQETPLPDPKKRPL